MADDFTIRLASLEDVAAIGAIYNYYIDHSTCTFHLEKQSIEEYRAWFADRTEAHPVTVAVLDEQVVGWAALSPWKSRQAYAHSVEGSTYVHHEMHRRGIGRALALDIIERARTAGHRVFVGGACTEHHGSIALQEQLGFEHIGVFRQVGYKFDRWLDVAYMQLML